LKFSPTFFTVFLAFCLLVPGLFVRGQAHSDAGEADTVLKADTIQQDSVGLHAAGDKAANDTLHQKTASGLTSAVDYSADDSTRLLKKEKVVLLYGNGRVKYENFELSAAFIRLDQEHNTVSAWGVTDPRTGRYTGRPIFKKDMDPPVKADTIVYNYETEKASITNVATEVEEGFIQAEVSKKSPYGDISLKNGRYSTCNLPHPHFYIASKKMLQTDNQVIFGPAYLVIEDVPFPLALPFGFFPKVNKRASGILFPTFGEDGTRGFFMRDLGYYIGLNDYWDAELRGTLYSRGSYEGALLARYRKNHKYDGNLSFNYSSTRTGIEGTPEYTPSKDFHFTWSHSQRAEANPGTTFSASVNAGTSSYAATTAAGGTYNIEQITNNVLSSRISYGKTFGLFNFTTGLSHSQDIRTRIINLTAPEYSFSMSSINPFDSKNRVGEQKWYQRISLSYSSSGSNSISTTESQLFQKSSLSRFTNGIMHSIPVGFSTTVMKYFQFNASIPYTERWSFQTISKRYLTADDSLVTDTVRGFARSGEYSLSGGFSTKIYGTVKFRKGRTEAIRHTMTPTIGFSYHPDFGQAKYGYYRTVQADATGRLEKYSIFSSSLYGSPAAGKSGSINFSLDNTVEAKRRAKGDTATATTKVPIIQGLSFGGSYNLAAATYRLSNIGFSGRTALFKQKLGLNFNGQFDPYALDSTGQRINVYAIKYGSLARLTSFSFSTDFSFNSAAAKSRNQAITEGNQNRENLDVNQVDALNRISRDPNAFVDFNVPWNINVSYSFNYNKPNRLATVTNTLNFSGDFSLTPKWKIQYNSGYDFKLNKLSFTSFSIYRDLHCWDLNFSWVPFGPYRSYSVDLKVRASILQDLKLSRRRDYYSNSY
jgi:hypothetical protein